MVTDALRPPPPVHAFISIAHRVQHPHFAAFKAHRFSLDCCQFTRTPKEKGLKTRSTAIAIKTKTLIVAYFSTNTTPAFYDTGYEVFTLGSLSEAAS